jgi:hypothetical protein
MVSCQLFFFEKSKEKKKRVRCGIYMALTSGHVNVSDHNPKHQNVAMNLGRTLRTWKGQNPAKVQLRLPQNCIRNQLWLLVQAASKSSNQNGKNCHGIVEWTVYSGIYISSTISNGSTFVS